MRISDWSSDVCSSDLLVDVAVRYGIVAIAIPFGIPARDAEGQLIVDERNGHRAFCQTHVVIADAKASITRKIAPWLRCGEVQRAARSVAAEQGSLCATQDLGVGHIEQAEITNDGAAIINAIDINAHRSEEHTSELQSLMRISYAVFCLK